jgi:hypothetical protein
MRATGLWIVVAALALGLAACGGGGGGGIVGTWVLDADKTFSEGEAKAKAEIAKMPEEQRKMAEGMMATQMETMKKMFSEAKITIEIKADNTATVAMDGMGEKTEGTGAWEKKGDKYSLALKTKDGKPAEGKDAKPVTLEVKDGRLLLGEGDEILYLKRK